MSSGEGLEPIALEPVDAVTVTTLVDSVTDSLLSDQSPAKRPSMAAAPRIATRLHIGGDTDDAVRADHGFSALVTVNKAGRETRVLFDAGRTPDGLAENMRRIDLSPGDIHKAVELPTTSKAALQGAGFEIVEQRAAGRAAPRRRSAAGRPVPPQRRARRAAPAAGGHAGAAAPSPPPPAGGAAAAGGVMRESRSNRETR